MFHKNSFHDSLVNMRLSKVLAYVLGTVCAFSIIIFFLLPTFVSTNVGTRFISSLLSKRGYSFQIESIDAHLFGPQYIEGLTATKNHMRLHIKTLISRSNFYKTLYALHDPKSYLFKGDLTFEKGSLFIQEKELLSNLSLIPFEETKIQFTGDSFYKNKKGFVEGTGFQKEKDVLSWKVRIKSLPCEVLSFFAPNVPWLLLLGPSLSSEGEFIVEQEKIDLNTFAIESQFLQAKGAGIFEKDLFYAKEDLSGSFFLSKELSAYLFTKEHFRPVSLAPITFILHKQEMFFPIKNFSWDKVHIPKIYINLHKMSLPYVGFVIPLLEMLKFHIYLRQKVDLWIQDTYVRIEKGVLSFPRTEVLVLQTYPLGVWGKLYLQKKRLDVNIGLTKTVLHNVFGIKNLPANYTIPMRLEGSFEDPTLHKSQALQVISSLILLQNSPLQGVVPPPRTTTPEPRHPFPWE